MAGLSYRAWGLLFALGGVVGFAFRPLIIKLCYAAHPVSPVTLLFLRMTLTLPFFVFVAWLLARQGARAQQSRRAALAPRDWAAVAGLGFVGYYLASFLDIMGLQYVGAGIGRLIGFLYPTIVVALSFLFLHKRPTHRELAALVICYAGITLVVFDQIGIHPQDRLFLFGVVLCLLNSVAYAVYLVAGSQLTQRIGSVRFTAYTMIAATIPAVVQFLLIEPLAALDLPSQVWWYVLLLVIFATILPVFMVAEALKRIGANHFALIGGIGPVVAVAAGAVGLEEPITLVQVAGSVLVISGVVLVSLKTRQS